jgi:hypothetical protein
MKQRARTRQLKQRLGCRVQYFDTEEELFASVRAHRRRLREKVSKSKFAFLRAASELHGPLAREPKRALCRRLRREHVDRATLAQTTTENEPATGKLTAGTTGPLRVSSGRAVQALIHARPREGTVERPDED